MILAKTKENDVMFRLTIPAGIKNGTTLTLKSEDHISTNLHVQVNVKCRFELGWSHCGSHGRFFKTPIIIFALLGKL